MDCVKCFGTGLVDGAIYCNCKHGKDLNKKVIEKFTGVKTKVTGRTTIDIEKDGEVIESLKVVFPKKRITFRN